jgi:hypothetical protein
VSGTDDPHDGEAEEANNKLNEGLKSCRAVVSNYRALLDKKRGKTAAKDDRSTGPAKDETD